MNSLMKKTLTMLSMIPLLVVGFGSTSFAEDTTDEYSAKETVSAFDAVEPYVTLDENKIVKLDVSVAKRNGVSNEAIKVAKEYMRIQNKMLQDVYDDPAKKLKVSDADKKKFKKFHDKVKNEGIKKFPILPSYFNFLLPAVDASGCNFNGPHPQPDVEYTGSYTTAQAGVDALPSGYDKVTWYAASFTHDYHDWVQAYGCADGIFRYQSAVTDHQNPGTWEHREPHSPGEPNPEVLEYGWPVWWWGDYVYNWHDP